MCKKGQVSYKGRPIRIAQDEWTETFKAKGAQKELHTQS